MIYKRTNPFRRINMLTLEFLAMVLLALAGAWPF